MPVTETTFQTGSGKTRWRYALIVWLFASFATGAVSMPSFADAAQPMMHGSAQMNLSHQDVTGLPSHPVEPSQHDHSQMQCCIVTCVVSFSGLLTAETFANVRMPSIYIFTAIDPLLRPLYLDSDPPVPRT